MKKGYKIDLDRIEEGYLFSEYVCSADTLSKAKSDLLKQCKYDGLVRKHTGKDICYLNIPIVRFKQLDEIEYNGAIVTKSKLIQIKRSEDHQKALQDILDDENTTHVYIRKNGYYYSENYSGYVEHKLHAGVYPKKDACCHANLCEDLSIIPIVNKDHNEYLNSHIEIIKARLL